MRETRILFDGLILASPKTEKDLGAAAKIVHSKTFETILVKGVFQHFRKHKLVVSEFPFLIKEKI